MNWYLSLPQTNSASASAHSRRCSFIIDDTLTSASNEWTSSVAEIVSRKLSMSISERLWIFHNVNSSSSPLSSITSLVLPAGFSLFPFSFFVRAAVWAIWSKHFRQTVENPSRVRLNLVASSGFSFRQRGHFFVGPSIDACSNRVEIAQISQN